MRATFPPAARLHHPPEFTAALKGRHLAKGQLFIVSSPRGQRPTEEQGARLGLVIAKRMAPLAVTRNTIKRVIREAFRQQRAELPRQDFVFRLYRRVEPTSLRQLKRQVREEVDLLLTKARR